MKNKMKFFFCGVLLFIFTAAGCASTDDRYAQVRPLSNKTPSRNKDVLEHIRFLEKANGRGDCEIEVLKVEDQGEELMAYVEYWTVTSCGTRTVYKVRKAPVGSGSYKYTVTYPSAADLLWE